MDTRGWDHLITELEAVSERLGVCGEANLAQVATLLRRRERIVRELTALLDRGNFPAAAAEPLRLALAGGVVLEHKLRAAADGCRAQLRDLFRDAVMAQALQIAGPRGPSEIDCHG